MERWSVYDKNRINTGRTMERGSKFGDGDYHMVIHVCIINSEGKMLIQQRQPFKEGWPNLWDISVGGSAQAGETSGEAAERELFEELGYKADLSDMRPFFTVNYIYGFDDFYIIEDEPDIDALVLQYEEVQGVKWASYEEIIEMIEEETFIQYHKSLIKMIFDMRHHRGAHALSPFLQDEEEGD